MPSDPAPEGAGDQRLHPLSLLFAIAAQVKSLLLPGIAVLFFASRGGHGELWFMLLFVPAVIATLVRYASYRYRFAPEELVVRHGIVFRNERHIPYARIQNIDLVQNPLHRLCRVAEVRLETAGGQKPEAVMRVLSLEAVERMRARVFAGTPRSDAAVPLGEVGAGGEASPARAPSRPLYAMRSPDVLLFGLISNKGLVVVAAALGVLWQLDAFEGWTDALSRDSLERYQRVLPHPSLAIAGLLGGVALVLLLIVLRLLSVVWAFAKFHGFRLTRQDDDLRAEYGLLSRVSKTVPRHRIQVLSTYEGFWHRRCGRIAVEVETAGSTGEEQEEAASSNRLWLAPLLRREQLAQLLDEILPGVELRETSWQAISQRAPRRLLRGSLYLSLAVTALAVWWLGAWGSAALLGLVPLAWLSSALYVRHTGYALVPGAVLFRSGWWNRRMSVARFGKIQSLERAESPFDRRHAMASVRVDTAGARGLGHSIDIQYLDVDVAARLVDRLFLEAERTAFHW